MEKKRPVKRKKKKLNKKFRVYIEFIICCLIIFSVFGLRNFYGKTFLKEDNVETTTTNTESANISNSNQATEQQVQEQQPKMTPEQLDTAINNILAKYETQNNKIGIVYNNLKTGYRFAKNENDYFAAASTTKVVYALHVYDRIAKGQLTETDMIPYNKTMLEYGGGEITNQPKKTSYELDYVIMNMLTYSDNTATNMILGNRANSTQVLTNYMTKLGTEIDEKHASNNKVTPALMEKVWNYLYNNQSQYPKIIEYLKDSKENNYEWIANGIPDKVVASKYGAISGVANDTAIVYGDSGNDFILIIYTENLSKAEDAITDIAKEINILQDK